MNNRLNQHSPNAPHRVAKEVELSDRESAVLQARINGFGFREIAKDLGIGIGRAHDTLKIARQKMRFINAPKIEEERALEADRYDAVQAKIMPLLEAEDPAVQVRAATALVALFNRRASMLGLDAPAKSQAELSGPGGAPVRIEAVSKRAAATIEALDTETLAKIYAAAAKARQAVPDTEDDE